MGGGVWWGGGGGVDGLVGKRGQWLRSPLNQVKINYNYYIIIINKYQKE